MATRLYFRTTEPSDVSPSFASGWTNTASAFRRKLALARDAADTISFTGNISWTAGEVCLHGQYVSDPLQGGVLLDVSVLIKCYRRVSEGLDEDNVTTRMAVRVVSGDGTITRATLLSVGHYGTGLEYSTTTLNRRFSHNEPCQATYTTQPGDRLVVECGHADTAGVTPVARMLQGSSAATDHNESEAAGNSANPWVEFSADLSFSDDSKPVSQLRTEQSAQAAYVLFIEGLPYAFATPHAHDGVTEQLLGSGANSWIGRYESNNPTHEVVGQRVVLPGLVVPNGLQRGRLNRKTGLFETTQATFELIDYDGTIAALFANEGKQEYELATRLPPSQAAAPNPIIVAPVAGGLVGAGDSIDPANMNIGIERIGPNRQRRFFFPLPEQGIGLHHQVNRDAAGHALADGHMGPAPIPVTTEPTIFAGRLAALYRVYRDPVTGVWPTWDEQHAAGGLEWVGVLRDQGTYTANRMWKIECFGWESILRKQLGTADTPAWQVINGAELELSDEERDIGITFGIELSPITGSNPFDYVIYPSISFGTVTLPATGTTEDYVAAISAAVQGVGDGTIAGDFQNVFTPFLTHDLGSGKTHQVSFAKNEIQIKRPSNGTTTTTVNPGGGFINLKGASFVQITMHEAVWRMLGWEPQVQKIVFNANAADQYEVEGALLAVGDPHTWIQLSAEINEPAAGTQTTAPGYYRLRFSTHALGNPINLDNNEQFRKYKPLHQSSGQVILREGGDQDIEVATVNGLYIEPDLTIDPGGYDAARYFLFRGKRAKVDGTNITDDEGELVEVDAEDESQVAVVAWDFKGLTYGTIDDPSGFPELHIVRWIPPRRFGVDRDRFIGEWNAVPGSDDTRIEMKPLQSLAYSEDVVGSDDIERSWGVFLGVLLSTGSGINDPGFDIFGSELGLGLPRSLVALSDDITDAFETVPGGVSGGLNQVRYAYGSNFSSWDVIADVIQPRGLALSLEGRRFGVVAMRPDPNATAISVDENDIYAPIDDPRATAPVQQLRATGSLDQTTLQTRWDPSQDKPLVDAAFASRDPGARYRRGDLRETIPAHGLMLPSWISDNVTLPEIEAWEHQARDLWEFDRPTLLQKRHFLIRTTVSRIKGQDLLPGTRVRFSSRKVVNPSGGYGVTNALGIVLSSTLVDPLHHNYAIELLIFADQFEGVRLFGPIAEIANPYAGNSTTIPVLDGLGNPFSEPWWSEIGGSLKVGILEWDRTVWTWHPLSNDVDFSTANTVDVDGALSLGLHRWTRKWLIGRSYDDQNADQWARALLMPVVEDDHTFGSGPTTGWPLLDF